MINRGLAAEIILLGFRFQQNLLDFSNLFDFLFNQKSDHWHSKQALLYFFKQLIENLDSAKIVIAKTAHDSIQTSKEYVLASESGS